MPYQEAPIPEPAGLARVLLGLPMVRRKRR
jgi:hypothetical protein